MIMEMQVKALAGLDIPPRVHRRILEFLNSAGRPSDLMEAIQSVSHGRGRRRIAQPIFDERLARTVFDHRESLGAYGFHDLRQLLEIDGLTSAHIHTLHEHFGPAAYGQWRILDYNTRHPDGRAMDVAHAALLHTGKVLFIPADYDSEGWPTPIWDPTDESSPKFEYPVSNPDYALFCGGHSFLSDGRLLVVGGGGDRNVTPGAVAGFKFDPVARSWTRTAGDMHHGYRWYPTVVTLGDFRCLITCGDGDGDMEVYNEARDRFDDITGDSRGFPNLYPGFHLLPNHTVFYSRTGWGSAGAQPATPDNESGFFAFSAPVAGSQSGTWTNITPAATNRVKGMSVMLLRAMSTNVRILVVGGASSTDNDTYEIIDVSNLTPSSAWNMPKPMPDKQSRRQCNAVLLPDGTVFVSGGIDTQFSPCALYLPDQDDWLPMERMLYIRTYHSVSLLLPSGKVMVAGGDGTPQIEIFSPPYLFHGPRPVISSAPQAVHHGETFHIDTRQADTIAKVVLVRPMAVTHQTDTEQRVIELSFSRIPGHGGRLEVTAPDGGFPHSLAPQGYYMLFILNRDGVPSEASWIALISPHRFTVLDRTPIASHKRHDDHMELWVVDASGTVRGNWWNGAWHEWYSLPNPGVRFPPRGHLAVLGRHEDHMEVFGISEDGVLRHIWWDGSNWQQWGTLGAPAAGLPPGAPLAVRSRVRDHMEVWVVAADGQVHAIWWDGTNWQGWYALPGATFPAGAPLASHCRHDRHMEIWGIDGTGTLRGNWWNGNWNGWYSLPTPPGGFGLVPGGHLAMLGRYEDHMEVWSIGTDDRLHGVWWHDNWQPWYTLPGPFSFPPGAPLGVLSRNEHYMEVWCVGDDDRLHGVWWNGSWEPWYTVGPMPIPERTPLATLSRNDDHMEVWCVAPDDPRPFMRTVHGVWWNGPWNPFYRLG
ncbi:hypothetical protein DC522_10715 [Microvirga sp. KLBC 81]|nr:hypothetical protein DC522_10715 [Microvirga sp. KLBC 81]